MTTKTDAPDKRKTRAAPSRRRRGPDYDQALAEFLDRAHEWLLGRPERTVRYPQDLDRIASAVGVPCPRCGEIARSQSYTGHAFSWKRQATQHWAAGITVTCER